jgi:hypothetical protein
MAGKPAPLFAKSKKLRASVLDDDWIEFLKHDNIRYVLAADASKRGAASTGAGQSNLAHGGWRRRRCKHGAA